MNEPRAVGPLPDADRDLRHLVEQEQVKISADLAAAQARTPAEWFDIFMSIVRNGVKQTIELSAKVQGVGPEAVEAEVSRLMDPQRPFLAKVRSTFQSHGLPLTEEMEFEGPIVKQDAAGAPHIVEWPRGVWIEFTWPGNRSENLRFEGQSAMVALSFILWWTTFQNPAMHMAGKDRAQKSRIVQPGSSEYVSYITEKAKAQSTVVPVDERPEPKKLWPPDSPT